MIAFFSPSESKYFLHYKARNKPPLQYDRFTFLGKDKKYREKIIQQYLDILHNGSREDILALFGTKEIDNDTLNESQNILHAPTIEALRLYSGVAYEHLDIENQKKIVQNLLFEHVIIFSNLFGVLKGGDSIPFYRLKQGKLMDKEYYRNFKEELDEWCGKEDILDLRAEFYQNLYIPQHKVYRPYFYKNNKHLSHYAKAYRGEYLRQVAEHFLLKGKKGWDLLSFEFNGLRQKGVREEKGAIVIEYDINT